MTWRRLSALNAFVDPSGFWGIELLNPGHAAIPLRLDGKSDLMFNSLDKTVPFDDLT